MSEQGLAARALGALVPSRRRTKAATGRTVADLVREREQAEAEFSATPEADAASAEAAAPEAGEPSAPAALPTLAPLVVPPVAPAAVPAVSPLVAQRIAESRAAADAGDDGWGGEDGERTGAHPVVAWDEDAEAASSADRSSADRSEADPAEGAEGGPGDGDAAPVVPPAVTAAQEAEPEVAPEDGATARITLPSANAAAPDEAAPDDGDAAPVVPASVTAAQEAEPDAAPEDGATARIPLPSVTAAEKDAASETAPEGRTERKDAAPEGRTERIVLPCGGSDEHAVPPARAATQQDSPTDRATAPVPLAELAFGAGSTDGPTGGAGAPPPRSATPDSALDPVRPAPALTLPGSRPTGINVVTDANSAALVTEAGTVPGLAAAGTSFLRATTRGERASTRGEPKARTEAAPRRPSAVPALLSDTDLREALGEHAEQADAEPEPSVVAMTTATTRPAPTPSVRAGALAPPWVRAALMGAEPRSSATPEQAAATRALRRTFGVPQDPGPVTLAGVEPVAAVAVLPDTTAPADKPGTADEPDTADTAATAAASSLEATKPRRPTPRTLVGAPVPVRYRAVRRDGRPIPGAEITAVDRAGVTVVDGRAGADGRGRFVVQQPGSYILVGAAPGYQPGATAVDAIAGTVDVDVLMVRSSSVAGSVRLDGEPVAAAQVTLVQDGEVVEMVRTDGDGRYRVADLTVGEYALAVAGEGCPPTVMVVAVPEEVDLAYDVDLACPPA